MKRIIATIIICTTIFCSCKSKHENTASKYLNADNLKEQLFTIDITKDTNLVTQQGLKIKIDANSIEASTPTVTLQVKEALTLAAMLKAGLTTETANGILSSDGMFYLATKEKSTIKKPLSISVPTVSVDENMQLYKGKEEDGKIVWEEPKKIEIMKPRNADGKTLFITKCASCHQIDKKLTGPELAWIENRWPNKAALYEYIKNSALFMGGHARVDTVRKNNSFERSRGYARCLFDEYKTVMTSFEGVLDDKQIDAIINYINIESKRSGFPENYKSIDSCYYYMELYQAMLTKRDSLVVDNGTMVKITIAPPSDADPNSDNGTIPTKVSTEDHDAEYYQFKIDAFGWYNIDDLLMDKFNSKPSELSVEIKSNETDRINTYLIITTLKVFAEGGKLDNGNFGFYTKDGKLPLPQGFEAFIVSIGEAGGKTYFGKTKFITSLKQNLIVEVKETTKEVILKQMDNLKLDSLNVSINKTKNFDEIKQLDAELKSALDKMKVCPPCLSRFH